MPEIKKTFTGGKMNKDLDERLVPNGEYRDAMNIKVSTSEDSDVGTAQNILGNKEIQTQGLILPDHAVTVASIADEKNDKLYYFVWTLDVDYIFEYSRQSDNPIPVFVDLNKDVLKFDPLNIITGINIIDDMLFWTDNINEPRKINIPRCKQGTPLITNQTKLINSPQQQLSSTAISAILNLEDIKEKHITVIKKAPKKPLDMRVNTSRDPEKTYTGVITIARENNQSDSSFSAFAGMYDFSSVEVGTDRDITPSQSGDTFPLFVTQALNLFGNVVNIGDINTSTGLTGWHSGPNTSVGNNAIAVGTKFAIAPFQDDGTAPGLPLTDYVLKGVVVDFDPGTDANTFDSGFMCKILSVVGVPPGPEPGDSTINYVIDLFDEEEKLFEFKFPRFSYRYKFEDGEYSPFAPFTQVAFSPGAFDYHPRKGYNLGMTNRATSIDLTRIITPQTPIDIVSVDILFKDEVSPNIYVVDTISPDDFESTPNSNVWNTNKGRWSSGVASIAYTITKETIKNILPSNQLLRPWDNVPRKALAQDVTGSRIVYGNYVQNYDLKTFNGKKYVPNMSVYWADAAASDAFKDDGLETTTLNVNRTETFRSIKSLREYQLGVVFTDEYGRETPVISNTKGSIKLEKERADKFNRFQVQLHQLNSKPDGMTHMKFYVKETAGEYYNMAMDRFYDAEDGNIWLAFPSSDRNKIDIDTFLILKKGSDQDTLVVDAARYKVIAIENEAPDFIKTNRILSASVTHSASGGTDLFGAGQLPLIGANEFKVSYSAFSNGPGRNLDVVTDAELYIEFQSGSQFSERYRISSISQNSQDASVGIANAQFSIQLEKPLEADVNFISNDPTGSNSVSINNGTIVNIYKYKVENTPKFDGRFFVKIFLDEVFTENIGKSFIEGLDFRTTASKMVYSMSNRDDHIEKHFNNATTGVKRFLTQGIGIEANDFNSLNAYSIVNDDTNRSYGYYAIDEFAAMSIYFRRLELTTAQAAADRGQVSRTNQIAGFLSNIYSSGGITPLSDIPIIMPLSKSSASQSNTVQYKNEHWRWKDNAYEESVGYTGHWKSSGNSYIETPHQIGADNPIETDVWFIDAGPIAARRGTDDNLAWMYLTGSFQAIAVADGNPPAIIDPQDRYSPQPGFAAGLLPPPSTGYEHVETAAGGFQNSGGLTISPSTNKWSMTISYGGIYGSKDNILTENFFNFGNWFTPNGAAQNSYYTSGANSKNTSFTQKFTPASQFRWREDPTQTIYTIPEVSRVNSLRHSARRSNTVGRSTSGGPFGGAFSTLAISGAVSMAEDLSHNFTSGFVVKNVPETLTWNPFLEGKIANGMEINIAAADSSGSITGTGSTCDGASVQNQLKIYVSTLTGTTTSTGVGDAEEVLLPGMALSAYFKGSSSADLTTNLGSTSNEFLVITEINELTSSDGFELVLAGYLKPLTSVEHALAGGAKPLVGTNYTFTQVGMNGYSHNSEFNINTIGRDQLGRCGAIGAVGYHLDFLEPIEPTEILSDNPAIWETEPKEIKELDIYYEASPSIPLVITPSNIHEAVPLGSKIINLINFEIQFYLVVDYTADGKLVLANPSTNAQASGFTFTAGNSVTIRRPDGLDFTATVVSSTPINILVPGQPLKHGHLEININMYTNPYDLAWHNCYSFGNGVESNRIRDNFNLPFISNGVRVSTTLETEYKEERRKYGLIYSGIYNSTGGINNLNQFIQAEKITKDVNPIYGSIQKLYSRDSDLVTLCEDKVLKILANKDAVFNADGNTNLTATENVLGQTIPFAGEYGISTNPESFASENYRAYFSDKVRGAILRLSRDGLTPISDAGMKDWFRDNLKISNRIIGSYDDRNNEYNVKVEKLQGVLISQSGDYSNTFFLNQNTTSYNFYQILGGLGLIATPYSDMAIVEQSSVLTFKETTRGWVSFKSFTEMQLGLSMANDYYTFDNGNLYKHNVEDVSRNTFYNRFTSSTIDVMFSDTSGQIKVYHTLNYEGSVSKIDKFKSEDVSLPYQDTNTYTDQETYNLTDKEGWFTKRIITDKEEGYINEFFEKEGKWFNNIKKCVNPLVEQSDTADFSFQGIGFVPTSSYGVNTIPNPPGFDVWETEDIDVACLTHEDTTIDWPVLIIDSSIPIPTQTTTPLPPGGIPTTLTLANQPLGISQLLPPQTPVVYQPVNVPKPLPPQLPGISQTLMPSINTTPPPPGGTPTTLQPVTQTLLLTPLPSTTSTTTNTPYLGPINLFPNLPSFKSTSLANFQSSPQNYRSKPAPSLSTIPQPAALVQPLVSNVSKEIQDTIFSTSKEDREKEIRRQRLEQAKKEEERILAIEIERQRKERESLEKAKAKKDVYKEPLVEESISKEQLEFQKKLEEKLLRRPTITPRSRY